MIKPALCIIVAASENNVIGRDGGIPWHISGDLKYVKARTWGKPIIMGRRTFESMGSKPLPGRPNIVITSHDLPEQDNLYIKRNLESALREAETIAAGGSNADEIFIFGGGKLYEEALPQVDRIYLTRVHITVDDGDAFFPELAPHNWKEVERNDVDANPDKNDPAHSFLTLERIPA